MPSSKRSRKDPKLLAAVETLYKAYVAPPEIQDRLSKEFGISTRAIRRYIEEVAEKCHEEGAAQRDRNRHQMRATMRAAMTKCLAAGNHKAAERWADKLCRIDGLYAAEKVVVSGRVDGVHVNADAGPLKPTERTHLEKVLLGLAAA